MTKVTHEKFVELYYVGDKYWKCPDCGEQVHHSFMNRHCIKAHDIDIVDMYKKHVEEQSDCKVCKSRLPFDSFTHGFDAECRKKCIWIDPRLRSMDGLSGIFDRQHDFEAVVNYKGTLPSVNMMYKVARSKWKAWIYLDPEVDDFKEHVEDIMRKNKMYSLFQSQELPIMCTLDVVFAFSQNFWVRDTSNIIKATEDAIVKASGVDDAFNIEVRLRKVLNDMDNAEHIFVGIAIEPLDESKVKLSNLIGDLNEQEDTENL